MKHVPMKIALGLRLTSVLGLASVLAFTPAQAEEPKKRDAAYQRIVMVDFKPGHNGAAMKLIKNYFQKASEKAGTPMPVTYRMMTGSWDMMLVWPLKNGLAGEEWSTSPESIKWFAALAEITGSEKAASAKWKEYLSHVGRTTSAFSYTPN